MTAKADNVPQPNMPDHSRPRFRGFLLIIFGLLIIWLSIKGWRIGTAVQSLLDQQVAAQSLMAGGIGNIDPDTTEEMVNTIRQNTITLRDETAIFMPLTSYLGWLPQIGPLVIIAPQLVEMADAGTETAVYAYDALKPALRLMQNEANNGSPLPQLVNIIADARPTLALAQQSFQRVVIARNQITTEDQLPGRIQNAFQLFDEWLPMAQDGMVMVQVAPNILAHTEQRNYLLLAQNEDELRATGGFISGIGLLTIENGDILALDFQDASTFDLESLATNSAEYDYPPQPLQELMGLDYLLLRDANYWPDFPITAQKAIELYNIVRPDIRVDGVIAIDQQFIAMLVEATGPVAITGSDTVITGENTVQSFRDAFNIKEGQTNAEWFQNRKAFLSTFSAAIRQKIETEPASLDMITLARNLYTALNERHLQLYMEDSEVTTVLSQLDWDGRLDNPTKQDYLLVLDTNMGFNKTNLHISRSYTYTVDFSTENPQAHIAINYLHNGPENNSPCYQSVSYANAPTYQEVADQCYFNFLRVYTPSGSSPNWTTEHFIPAQALITGIPWTSETKTITEFTDFTTFTNFLMVQRNQMLVTEIAYTLPETVLQQYDSSQRYQLFLRKQAGTGPERVTLNFILPPDGALLDIEAPHVQDLRNDNHTVTIIINLVEDTTISLDFES